MPQFLIPRPASSGEEITLSRKEAHHLRDVLRIGSGDVVRLFDGEGARYVAETTVVSPKEVRLRVREKVAAPEERGHLILGQALLKREKMETVLQKAVELGVGEIVPLLVARSVPRGRGDDRLPRWQRIVEEAAKQCGALKIPLLQPLQPYTRLVVETKILTRLLFWEQSGERLSAAPAPGPEGPGQGPRSILLLIGPEGGWTAEEVDLARQSGFRLIGLGSRILRAETAAIAAITLIQHELGNI